MTTDLTGDFGLGEDEFDWDVFLPDPDEAELAAEAAALEDEAELNLDDSGFDWEAALREDGESESGGDNGARAGAAYDRIVDMVRRSFEEPEVETAELESETTLEPVAAEEPDAPGISEPEPIHEEFVAELVAVSEPEPGHGHLAELVPEHEPELVDGPAGAFASYEAVGAESESAEYEAAEYEGAEYEAAEYEAADYESPEPQTQWGSSFSFVSEPDLESESETVPAREWDQQPDSVFVAAPDVEPTSEFEPESELEPFSTLEEPAATAVAAWTVESALDTPSQPEPTWAAAPAEPGLNAAEVESVPTPVGADTDEGSDEHGAKKQRSRVFTATIVLACIFLVVGAAGVAVRELHRSTPTATPPAHTAPTVSPQDVARLESATDAVDSATTAASVGLTSLSAFPTPTNVETVINPYISSLQLYETVLAGSTVPAAAQPASASAEAQLRQDLQFLDTIDGLPPAQLGAFLLQFDTDATHLQTTLSALEQNLHAPGS